MLEEALRSGGSGSANNNNNVSPEVAATMMLSFIQSDLLPAGGAPSGAAAEQRFFRLYGPLMERIFGPLISSSKEQRIDNNNKHTINGTTTSGGGAIISMIGITDEDECHHGEGGWLATETPWRPSMTGPLSSSSITKVDGIPRPRPATSLDSDPVVKLIGGALSTGSTPSSSTATSASNGVGSPYRKSSAFDSRDQLPPTLIEAMSKESESRPNVVYSFPIHGFSKALQESWISLVRLTVAGNQPNEQQHQNQSIGRICMTDNDVRLISGLLRNPPTEQRQIIDHIQRTAVETSLMEQEFIGSSSRQPFHTISPSNARPLLDTTKRHSDNKNEIEEDRRPHVMMDMLEYYLFVFIRFPLAQPSLSSSFSVTRNHITGVNVHRIRTPGNPSNLHETYGETLYYHIFKRYLRLFLPFESSTSLTSSADGNNRSISFGTSNVSMMSGPNATTSQAVRTSNTAPLLRESELFLRIMIALWIESPTRLLPTSMVIGSIQERRMRATGIMSTSANTPNNFDLDSSFDLVLAHSIYKYDPPPMQVKRCLRTLVVHALLDPVVKSRLLDASSSVRTAASPISSPLRSNNTDWCLTSCMTALQQPLYNFIRATFRYSSIHAPESPFYVAFNIWLIWLEPWNVVQVKRYSQHSPTSRIIESVAGDRKNFVISRNLTNPRESDPSLFDKDPATWEPYIAANLHMYLIPLAIFLRRSRELDFSARKFDRSIQTVKRVFRVFSPSVMQVLLRYLDKQSTAQYSYLVTLHERNLGVYGPPPAASLSLSSCKGDMQSLLEEIDMQHVKKISELDVIDRFIGWVEGWFGQGVVSGEERLLDKLVERAKLIVNIPMDCEFLPRSSSSRKSSSVRAGLNNGGEDESKYRNPDGTLTLLGRQQLLAGAWKCTPDDVMLIGDPMRIKPQSYEIAWMVTVTLFLSDYLNEKCNLVPKRGENGKIRGFRFNLRFFADYRNLLFCSIMLFLLKPRWFLPF